MQVKRYKSIDQPHLPTTTQISAPGDPCTANRNLNLNLNRNSHVSASAPSLDEPATITHRLG